jgi:hypothetical protein
MGRLIPVTKPRVSDVFLVDIAAGLGHMNRYAGRTVVPYTVAQHSVLVYRILLALYGRKGTNMATLRAGLMHDASEAYLGDVIAPVKHFLADYKRIEADWQRVILRRFFIMNHCEGAVHLADELAYAMELERLVPLRDRYREAGGEPRHIPMKIRHLIPFVVALSPGEATDLFLETAFKLKLDKLEEAHERILAPLRSGDSVPHRSRDHRTGVRNTDPAPVAALPCPAVA